MSDWKDNKGLGPWTFVSQGNKPFYNEGDKIASQNDPVWDLERGDQITPAHHPWCGYWPKTFTIPATEAIDVAIFGLFGVGSHIYGYNFNGESLTFAGAYESPDNDINGLVPHADGLLTLAGEGSTASLRTISTTAVSEVYSLVTETTPFNNYDAINTTNGMLEVDSATGKSYYIEGVDAASDGGRLLKISAALGKDLRSFIGSVVIGTDTNNYINIGHNPSYQDFKKPITGEFWELYYNLITDNLTDRTPVAWGVTPLYTNYAIFPRLLVHGGALYSTLLFSLPSPIRKYSLTDLSITTEVTINNLPKEITASGSFIYVVSGLTSCTITKHNASDLAVVDSIVLSPGKAGDVTVTSTDVIVANYDYASNETLFVISLSTFTVTKQIDLGAESEQAKIAVINDRYVILAGARSIRAVDLDRAEVIDEKLFSENLPPSTWFTKELVVISN